MNQLPSGTTTPTAAGSPTAATTSTGLTAETQRFVDGVRPLLDAIGASLVDRDGAVLAGRAEVTSEREVPLMWEGRLVGLVRLPGLQDALGQLVDDVESQLGAPLHQLDRRDKQRAVQLLDRRGAFVLRKAVDEVAELLGVSRFTVYNYLNRERDVDDPDPDQPTPSGT